MDIFNLSPLALPAIPLVIAVVQVIKSSFSKVWLPYFAILFSVALMALTELSWQAVIVQGLLVGLSAMGAYSGGKAVAGK